MPIPSNKELYEQVKFAVYQKYPKHSAYRSGLLVQEYKRRGGTYEGTESNKNSNTGFTYTYYAKHTDASAKSDIPYSVSDGMSYSTNLLTDFFTQYKRSIKDFSLNIIVGGQWNQNQSKNIGVSGNGLVVPDLFNVSNGVGTPGASESNFLSRSMGV